MGTNAAIFNYMNQFIYFPPNSLINVKINNLKANDWFSKQIRN